MLLYIFMVKSLTKIIGEAFCLVSGCWVFFAFFTPKFWYYTYFHATSSVSFPNYWLVFLPLLFSSEVKTYRSFLRGVIMKLWENADFCCLEYLFWLTFIKASWKCGKSYCVLFWVGGLVGFLLWTRARETERIKNRALKFRFGLWVGKGLFNNSTTFIQHSQTAMNDAAEHHCGVNSWHSLTEEYNKNGEMVHGEPSADHIQIHSTPDLVPLNSFEPSRWQLSKHKFKGYECSI